MINLHLFAFLLSIRILYGHIFTWTKSHDHDLLEDDGVKLYIQLDKLNTPDLVDWSRIPENIFEIHNNYKYEFKCDFNDFKTVDIRKNYFVNGDNISSFEPENLGKSNIMFVQEISIDKINELIKNIFLSLSSLDKPYYIVLFGSHEKDSSQKYCPFESININHNRVSRAIANNKSQDLTKGLFVNATCLYLYMYNVSLYIKRQKEPRFVESIPLNDVGYQIVEMPDCTNRQQQNLKLSFTQLPQGIQKLNMRMTFTKNKRSYWRFLNASLDFAIKKSSYEINGDDILLYLPHEIGAHVNTSYVCAEWRLREKNIRFERNYVEFRSQRVQVQAFGIFNESFSRKVNDCTGFFSPALWMGLFSTGILLAVLAFGLTILLPTKTMDKFENPKALGPLNLGASVD